MPKNIKINTNSIILYYFRYYRIILKSIFTGNLFFIHLIQNLLIYSIYKNKNNIFILMNLIKNNFSNNYIIINLKFYSQFSKRFPKFKI